MATTTRWAVSMDLEFLCAWQEKPGAPIERRLFDSERDATRFAHGIASRTCGPMAVFRRRVARSAWRSQARPAARSFGPGATEGDRGALIAAVTGRPQRPRKAPLELVEAGTQMPDSGVGAR